MILKLFNKCTLAGYCWEHSKISCVPKEALNKIAVKKKSLARAAGGAGSARPGARQRSPHVRREEDDDGRELAQRRTAAGTLLRGGR